MVEWHCITHLQALVAERDAHHLAHLFKNQHDPNNLCFTFEHAVILLEFNYKHSNASYSIISKYANDFGQVRWNSHNHAAMKHAYRAACEKYVKLVQSKDIFINVKPVVRK